MKRSPDRLINASSAGLRRRRIMKTRQLVYLFCALCASPMFAAPKDSYIPVWLRSQGNSHPGSLEIFNAFHTRATPSQPRHVVQVPIQDGAAVYPNEFRSFNGVGNNVA